MYLLLTIDAYLVFIKHVYKNYKIITSNFKKLAHTFIFFSNDFYKNYNKNCFNNSNLLEKKNEKC